MLASSSISSVKIGQVKNGIVPPSELNASQRESFRDAVYRAALEYNDSGVLRSYSDIRPIHWEQVIRDSESADNSRDIVIDESHKANSDLNDLKQRLDSSERKYARIYEKLRANKFKKIGIFAVESVLLTVTMWNIIGFSDYPSLSLVPADSWAMFSFGTLTVLGVLFFGVGPAKYTFIPRFSVAMLFLMLRAYTLVMDGDIASPYAILSLILAGIVPILTYYAYVIDAENEKCASEISNMEDLGETPSYWKDAITNQNGVISGLNSQFESMENAINLPSVIQNTWESQVASTADKIIQASGEVNRQKQINNTYNKKILRPTFSNSSRSIAL